MTESLSKQKAEREGEGQGAGKVFTESLIACFWNIPPQSGSVPYRVRI